MTGWIVLCVVLVLILLLLWSRIRGVVVYGENDLSVQLKIAFIKIQILPSKEKKKKPKHDKPEEEHKKEAKKPIKEEDHGGTLSLFRELLSLAIDVLGRLKRKIRVDRLHMKIVWGGEDPAAIAMGYGAVNAVVGMIWPILDHNFNIRARNIETDVNYEQKAPTIFVRAKVTIRIGSALMLAVRMVRKGIPAYRMWKSRKAVAQQSEVEVT